MIANDSDISIIEETIQVNRENLANKKIIIFGCTMYARNIRNSVEKLGNKVYCFIDNNPDKAGYGKSCLGAKVKFPYEIDYCDNDIRIIICSKYAFEMIEQLKQLGMKRQNIIRIKIAEDIVTFKDSKKYFDKAKKEVLKGAAIFQQIHSDEKRYQKIFVCPYPGTGDIYVALSMLMGYLKKNKINRYSVVLSGASCRKVAELFVECDIYVLDTEAISALLKFWEFAGEGTVIKPLLYWGWRTKRYLYANRYPQICFSNMFCYDVYEYEKMEEFCKPRQLRLDITKDFFRTNRLSEGKTVILAPYAGSFISELSIVFWEKLTERFNSNGYVVCTNSNGYNEPPVKNTYPIFFPYNQAINFMNLAGYFVGIRSGLCDVISSSKCKKVILYEDTFNSTNLSFFGLKKMGLCCENLLELDYDALTTDEDTIIEDIIHFIINGEETI